MKQSDSIVAIYDFELFPYALGDVLTWNVRTAMRCAELGRQKVDVYICVDEKYPAGIYQRGMVNTQNFELFFSELYGAFSTHPCLGNIHVFRRRDELLERLDEILLVDPVNADAIEDYLGVLQHRVSESLISKLLRSVSNALRRNERVHKALNRYLPAAVKTGVNGALLPNENLLNDYFIKYIHSHERINAFAAEHGGIPLLKAAPGCIPDVDEILVRRFAGKKVVPFHLRLRRLDAGYGGEHSYERDSDFLEWYDFLKQAASAYPDVEFVALGRLQEKPLELLRLPNVTSLRVLGMGLAHELTLMLKSDLFIGTSSGFAAFANFSTIPHYITKMSKGACHAYAIPEGADHLPFAGENQKLIYAQETSGLLMRLLREGLGLAETEVRRQAITLEVDDADQIDVRGWLAARSRVGNSAATTSRFYVDDTYRLAETAYLILPALERAKQLIQQAGGAESTVQARAILDRLSANFPEVCARLPQYHVLCDLLEPEAMKVADASARLDIFDMRPTDIVGIPEKRISADGDVWHCANWTVVGGDFKPLPEERDMAVAIRAREPNTYWHSESFVGKGEGQIIVRFQARTSHTSARHRFYIFEDGNYRAVGEVLADTAWQSFEIPISTRPGALLELQIDQPHDWQWLSIKDVRVSNADSLPLVRQPAVPVPMSSWSGHGGVHSDADGNDSLHWPVVGQSGYVQTPVLPPPGDAGLLVSFEARTDRPAVAFTALYLFEGERYRKVADYAFSTDWRKFSLHLRGDTAAPLKVQIDYPAAVDSLSVRNFTVVSVNRMVAAQ